MELEKMREIDITKVDPDDLVDIRDVQIEKNVSSQRQIESYIRQIKNPYCYKYGEYIVKVSFEDTKISLSERLKEMILKSANVEDS